MKKTKLAILMTIVLVLNLIWEFSHFHLYVDLTGIPSTFHLVLASFVDVILVGLIFGFNSLLEKGFNWIERPK